MASTSTQSSDERDNHGPESMSANGQSETASTDPPVRRNVDSLAEMLIQRIAESCDSSRDQRPANPERNRPASADDTSDDDDYIEHMERSVHQFVQRNVQRTARQLTAANRRSRARNTAADEERPENVPSENEDNEEVEEEESAAGSNERREHIRMRNQLADRFVEMLAPGLFHEYDSSDESDDRDDREARVVAALFNNNDGIILPEQSSASSSSSSSTSSSSPSSSSDSSGPYVHSSESEYDYVELPRRREANVDSLECLQATSVNCKWNILRDISQRQHGVSFHRTSATVGRYHPIQFQKRAYGSAHLVQRLGLMHKLVQHTGCVNSLNFHPSGKLLASGSDDLRINLWNWETKKLLKSIKSGHRKNVFQTKFMPCDGYENELEIISTGRDGHVRHTTVRPSGQATTRVIFRSQLAIHKVAIPARNELAFLMAGEDEKVRLCDMRQAKVQTVVDVGKQLYSISTHPYDSEFCVSGSGSSVRVYDLRRAQKPLRMLFVGEQAEGTRSYTSITCAVYNHDGTEILASYCDDDIYMFKMEPPDGILNPTNRYRGHCNLRTIKGVSFFGPHSEFVVSGSDCGYVYIWEKSSQKIVNWLKSYPGESVNCLEPHPEFPILATSGVDHDIRVWAPKGLNDEQTAPVFDPNELKRFVRRNVYSRGPYRNEYGLPVSRLSRFFPAFGPLDRERQDEARDEHSLDLDRLGRRRLDCNPS
uniref:Uncharacterized protein n=1 Tax=Anopheles epiroticus TaxID=199890 RepID=A0A182PEQ2_9DIPT